MSVLAADPLPAAPVASFDDDAWEDLLNFVEERRVIPIVGPELVTVQAEHGTENLYAWLARTLAARLGQPVPAGLPAPTLNDVIVRHLAARGRREDLYARVRTILREANFAPSPALVKLAEITDFDLFVSTSFDTLMEDALNQVRFAGARTTEVLAYTPNKLTDLAVERSALTRPLVFQLLGRLSATPSYAISDEDVLEFVCALQTRHHGPEKLLSELEHNHLLLLGGDFSDWMTRLFLRLAKRRRLSEPRDVGETVADLGASREPGLVFFLQHVSSSTRLFAGGAIAFVDELHRRWSARRGGPAKAGAGGGAAGSVRFLPPEREMSDGAVFISYAREDLAAVQQLKAGLDAAGIPAWFDMERLEGGDDFAHRIRSNIARCGFFLPVISANTQRRVEGWFRREWSWAVDRTEAMADGARFILPVCVDDTDAGAALVPAKIKALHFTRLPAGEMTTEFTNRLRELTGGKRG
ncbi:MAG: toll/interleukin-1 receptor domain-containing protein [Verrucomicrobia bacterium]|nr:toll/interleukin-1 receptor domain-containing protein [Verrucomicrobiota bacterium]